MISTLPVSEENKDTSLHSCEYVDPAADHRHVKLATGRGHVELAVDIVCQISEYLSLRDRSRLCMLSRAYLPVMWLATNLDIKYGTGFRERGILEKFRGVRNLKLSLDHDGEDDSTLAIEKSFRCPPTLISLKSNTTSVLESIIKYPPRCLEYLDIDESMAMPFGHLIRKQQDTVFSIFDLPSVKHLKLGVPILWAICATISQVQMPPRPRQSRLRSLRLFRLQSGASIQFLCKVMGQYVFSDLKVLELEGEYCTIYKSQLEVIRNVCPGLEVMILRGFTLHASSFSNLEELTNVLPTKIREIRFDKCFLPIPNDDKVLHEFILWLSSEKFPHMEKISIVNSKPIKTRAFPREGALQSKPTKKKRPYQCLKSLLIADTIPASMVLDSIKDLSASLIELSIDVGSAFRGQKNIWNAIALVTANLQRLYIKFDASNIRLLDEYVGSRDCCCKAEHRGGSNVYSAAAGHNRGKHPSSTTDELFLDHAKPVPSLKTLVLENATWFLLSSVLPIHSNIEKLVLTCVQYPYSFGYGYKHTPINLCMPSLKEFHFQTYNTGVSCSTIGQLVTSVTAWAKDLELLSVYIDWGSSIARTSNPKYDKNPTIIDYELLDHIQRSCMKLKCLKFPSWIVPREYFVSLASNSDWIYTLESICVLVNFVDDKLLYDFCRCHRVLKLVEIYYIPSSAASDSDIKPGTNSHDFHGRKCIVKKRHLKDLRSIENSIALCYF